MLTQMTVDLNDPAFADPTKPIGLIYEEAEARELAEKFQLIVKPICQHFRRVVPSPRPLPTVEHDA